MIVILARLKPARLLSGLLYVAGIIWCLGALIGAFVPWHLTVAMPWGGGYLRMDIRCARGVNGIGGQLFDATAWTGIQAAQGPMTRIYFRPVYIQRFASSGRWQLPTPVLLSRWMGGVDYGDFAATWALPGRMPYVGVVIGVLPQVAILGLLVWRSIRWLRRLRERDCGFEVKLT